MKKIIPANKIQGLIKKIKNSKQKIVVIGGCFDILHLGHIRFLKQAKKLGEVLIILLESDERIKSMKGQGRPINSQEIRAEILGALQDVDFVVLLPSKMENKDYDFFVNKIKPDYIAVTKGDAGLKNKKRSAKLVNAKVVEVINLVEGYSTNKIIASQDQV